MRRDAILAAERCAGSRLLTIGGAAAMLQMTTEGVRDLVRTNKLPCEWTQNGQRIFWRSAVEHAVSQRAKARVRSRAELLADVRCRMLHVRLEPRQARLRLTRDERALEDPQVKASGSLRQSA